MRFQRIEKNLETNKEVGPGKGGASFSDESFGDVRGMNKHLFQ